MLTKSTFLDDLEVESPLEFHAGGAEDDPDCPGRPSLFPDDLAQVLRATLSSRMVVCSPSSRDT
jgi:hypothetical protein